MIAETPPLIDVALVRRLLSAQFPNWAVLPIEPVHPGGWDNRTFRLGNDMSVRLPSAAAYVAQVEKEHLWLPRLASHLPLQIPVPLAKGVAGAGYPWTWSIYRWLEGHPASTGRIVDMDAFAHALGGFLFALHRIEGAGGPPAGPDNFHRGGSLAVYDTQARSALAALGDRVDRRRARAIWDAALTSTWQRRPVWVHGDIAAGNLLVRDGKLGAIIDFGSAAVGDPACDLTIAWSLFSDRSREIFRAAVALDEATWDRARGWALWKAAITVTGHDDNQRELAGAASVLRELLADNRIG